MFKHLSAGYARKVDACGHAKQPDDIDSSHPGPVSREGMNARPRAIDLGEETVYPGYVI